MTKKDYKILAEVFNYNAFMLVLGGDHILRMEGRRQEYFRILKRFINIMKRDVDKNFDADKFMNETNKIK